MRVELSKFSFDVPDDWCDITPDDDDTYPFTIALDRGVGTIQFSFADWVGGKEPDIDDEVLNAMFARFCEKQALPIEQRAYSSAAGLAVCGSCATPDGMFGAWYVSDGANVALITYTALSPDDPASRDELAVAEGVVSSAVFSR